jgi:phosphoserine phosphatase RsbU/P
MSSTSNSASTVPQLSARKRIRNFWDRVTEGMAIDQLFRQFRSEARDTYGLYSKDVDWEAIHGERKKWKRPFLAVWALFQAMLMKLSPARRVLLLIAVIALLFPTISWGSNRAETSIELGGLGTFILFVLLALELGDRITMKRDLEIAREIQQWLVPNNPPVIAGVDVAFATRPQNTVAGDYFDAFLRSSTAGGPDPHALILAVADVAGKSVPAALIMATFQASLRALSATPASLEEMVIGLDRYARAHSLEGRRFTTAFLAQVDPSTRAMAYVNAGHNDPILRRAAGTIERLSTGGPPLGLPIFDSESAFALGRVQLQPGDLLFIFTDGVIEAVNEKGEEFGEMRLLPCIAGAPPTNSAADVLKRVMDEVNTFVGFARQHDDITCLVLRVTS